MNKIINLTIVSLFATFLLLGCSSDNESASTEAMDHTEHQSIAERVRAAFDDPTRPAEDAESHANRKPDLVIEFLGVEPGMTALDILAARGYYTENLAAAVGPNGKVYMQNPEAVLGMGNITESINTRLTDRLPQVELVIVDASDLGLENEVDVATMVNVFHDMYNNGGHDPALATLQSIYNALKPGGVLGLIDHIGAAGDNTELHRLDPEVARSLLNEAGFEIEAESDIHMNSEDDYSLPVFDETVRGHTHRMIIKARKPG